MHRVMLATANSESFALDRIPTQLRDLTFQLADGYTRKSLSGGSMSFEDRRGIHQWLFLLIFLRIVNCDLPFTIASSDPLKARSISA